MEPADFNLRHLRAFCAVADGGSLSAASEVVFLSQPAITQAIAKLEKALGTPMFVRKSRGVFLTEPGALFRNRAERALSRISDGVRLGSRPRPKHRKSRVPAIRSAPHQRPAAGSLGGCGNRKLQLGSQKNRRLATQRSPGFARPRTVIRHGLVRQNRTGDRAHCGCANPWRVRRNSLFPSSNRGWPRSIPGWATIRLASPSARCP